MNQKSKIFKRAIGVLPVLLVVLIGIVVVLDIREPNEPEVGASIPHQTEPVISTDPVQETGPVAYEGVPVETPCGTVYLPDDWDEPIVVETVSENPTVIDFLADDVKLYSLIFSKSADDTIGCVQTEDGIVYVGMEIEELDHATNQLLSMQESINVLLEQLSPDPITSAPVEEEPVISDIVIETAYGDLLFPGKWEDHLQVKELDVRTIEFYGCINSHAPVLLFTLNFENEDGDIVAELVSEDYSVISLAIDIAEINFENGWNDEETNLIYSMQEELNYLMDSLLG